MPGVFKRSAVHMQAPALACVNCDHRSLRMFCNLDGPALEAYASIGEGSSLPKGVLLFTEDGQSDDVFVICTGQVKLFCTSKQGRTLILKLAMPGDVLGLGAVIAGTPYEVSAETMEPTQIKAIKRPDFLAFLARHGEGSLHAARALSVDYKAAFVDARMLALSGSAAARLAALLLDWGRNAASCGKHEMRFTMVLTHEELANMVGSSRETVTRMLTRFKKQELIRVHGSSMLILAPDALASMAV